MKWGQNAWKLVYNKLENIIICNFLISKLTYTHFTKINRISGLYSNVNLQSQEHAKNMHKSLLNNIARNEVSLF